MIYACFFSVLVGGSNCASFLSRLRLFCRAADVAIGYSVTESYRGVYGRNDVEWVPSRRLPSSRNAGACVHSRPPSLILLWLQSLLITQIQYWWSHSTRFCCCLHSLDRRRTFRSKQKRATIFFRTPPLHLDEIRTQWRKNVSN